MNPSLDELARDAVASSPTHVPEMEQLQQRVRQRHRKRRLLGGLAALPLVVLVAFGAAAVLAQGDPPSQVIAAGSPGTDFVPESGPVTAASGDIVWPQPPRGYSTVDELIDSFIAEVLRWPTTRVLVEGNTGEAQPQGITLVNLDNDRELVVVAAPNSDDWGFLQIGSSMVDGQTTLMLGNPPGGEPMLSFEPPPGTSTHTVEVRYLDGEITTAKTTSGELSLPAGRSMESVHSVLIVHSDGAGDVASVTGGHFNSPSVTDPSGHPTPTPTTVPGSGEAEPNSRDSVRVDIGNNAGEVVGSVSNAETAARRDRLRVGLAALVGDNREVPQDDSDRLYEALQVLDPIDVIDADGDLVGYLVFRFVPLDEYEPMRAEAQAVIDEFQG